MFLSGMHMVNPYLTKMNRIYRIKSKANPLGFNQVFKAFILYILVNSRFLFLAYLFDDSCNVDSHRAGAHASAAAGAEGLAELVVVVLELVHDPVAVPLGLHVPRIVAGGVIGEFAEAAGVPVLAAGSFALSPFVVDVEAVAGRADEGAGAAPHAPLGDLLPEVALEVVLQPLPDLLQIQLLHGRLGKRNRCAAVSVGEEAFVPLHQ